jgi:hypothetical protein
VLKNQLLKVSNILSVGSWSHFKSIIFYLFIIFHVKLFNVSHRISSMGLYNFFDQICCLLFKAKNSVNHTRAIQKVTSSELLRKHAIGENKFYYIPKYTYILKLLLNIVTAGIEALVVSGNKFLYVCVKEVCRL